MATLTDAIEIYKYHRSYAFLAGVNNVVCLYKQRKWVFDKRVADYVIYGGHQNRVVKRVGYFNYKHNVLEPAENILMSSFPMLKTHTDFDALHANVMRLIGRIKGISNLTIYDAALRLGFIIGVFPQKKVYVYSGAWIGLRGLQKDDPSLFSPSISKEGVYDISLFRPAFGYLESMFIEDFLCVFDNELDHLSTCTREDLLKTIEFHGTHKKIKDCFLYNYDFI